MFSFWLHVFSVCVLNNNAQLCMRCNGQDVNVCSTCIKNLHFFYHESCMEVNGCIVLAILANGRLELIRCLNATASQRHHRCIQIMRLWARTKTPAQSAPSWIYGLKQDIRREEEFEIKTKKEAFSSIRKISDLLPGHKRQKIHIFTEDYLMIRQMNSMQQKELLQKLKPVRF